MKNYQELFSGTAKSLKPSGIRRFFSIADEMADAISLGVGEPDFKTPLAIRKAGIENLEKGVTRYTANAGITELQEGIAAYLDRRFGMKYQKNQVLVTVGGSEGIDLCIRAFANPGDEILIPEPAFVAYSGITQLTGATPVPIVTREEDDFRLTPEALRAAITPKTKLLVFPFPCNPTGGVMRARHMEEIAEILRGTDIMVLSDEIYAELTYGGERHVSISTMDGMYDRTVVVNGFSKAFAMTGWRLGWITGPEPVMDMLNRIHQYAIMCAPTTSQYAAIEALRSCDDDVEAMVREYDSRRRMVVDAFNRMGLHCFDPQGAFYTFPSIQSTGLSSIDFCERLLDSQRVALVPGCAFGDCGEGFVRVCYCYAVDHIREALVRIERFLGRV